MKWLCVHLPRLALDTVLRADPALTCVATVENEGARRWIHDCDGKAGGLGVRPGMQLATAYALAPELRALPRDHRGEARLLRLAALRAYRFSNRVSLEPPANLIVEIAHSRRLLERRRPMEFFRDLGLTVRLSVAPTPRAAALLARAGRSQAISDLQRLGRLPLEASELAAEVIDALGRMGIHTIEQLLALPRDGLNRRFGAAVLDYIDRLTGRRADPLIWFEPPARFDGELDLVEETGQAQALVFAASRLLRDLCAFLEARQLAVQQLRFDLTHAHGEATRVCLGLLEPDRRAERMIELTRERLNHLQLPAPVRRIALATPPLVTLANRNRDLFEGSGAEDQQRAWERLLEQLRARLGEAAVQRLACVAEHAPERAWCWLAPDQKAAPSATRLPLRPPWLLARPQPVDAAALSLETGPERIETGWWQGRDLARDYYVARAADGRKLWVYRNCREPREWFVHGLFG